MGKRIGVISLGCAKNQVNAEQMMYLLREAGYEILPSVEGADVVIINTCGFIDSAKSEAIDNILAMAALKAEGVIGKILVTGCLSQRYQQEILQELPEVDGILGTGSYGYIVSAVKQLLDNQTVSRFDDIDAPVDEVGRILTTPEYYAFLKIAEGCDNRCSYCVIPSLRGKYRSRAMEDCLQEARALAAAQGYTLDGTLLAAEVLRILAEEKADLSRWAAELPAVYTIRRLLHTQRDTDAAARHKSPGISTF